MSSTGGWRGGRRQGRRRLAGRFAPALGEPADDDIKHRRQEDSKKGDSQHAAEHRGAQGLAHFGAGATRKDKRNYPKDEGEGGHQNGPQAKAAGIDSGFAPAKAFILTLFGELDNQDGVLT